MTVVELTRRLTQEGGSTEKYQKTREPLLFVRQAHTGAEIEICVQPSESGSELVVVPVSVRKLTRLVADLTTILGAELRNTTTPYL